MRKLSAIMFTDIVGYTALMGEDEHKALQLLQRNRELLKPIIEQFRGEWLKEMGDGTLSCFASTVDAVNCAQEIQKTLGGDHDLSLRIGIHIGDVVFEKGDVFGDGVNVASRIEPLAAPGGICISGRVHDDIQNKPDIQTVFLGEKALKHVKRPIKVYALTGEGLSAPSVGLGAVEAGPIPTKSSRSIAVLPFIDMSQEQDQEYFCDGMAEELIDALSKIKELRVSARTSAFSFKGTQHDIREIGNKLNVATVLEGSVRKAGNRLRITAQLINIADGYHMWSEKYDRELKDIFAIQDEIAGNIVRALRIMLTESEKRSQGKPPTASIEAYDYYLQGRRFFFDEARRKKTEFARKMFTRATEIDPGYALAYAGLADTCSWIYMYFEGTQDDLRKAEEASLKALELAPELAEVHVSRALGISLSKRYDEAEKEFETAIRLDARLFEAHYFYARMCYTQGKLEKAARLFVQASEVRPEDYHVPGLLSQTYDCLGREAEAEVWNRRAWELGEKHLELNPDDARALYMGAGLLIKFYKKREQGLEWADRALAIDPEDSAVLYNVACANSMAGEIEKAVTYLEKSVNAGFTDKGWIEHDPDFNPLHSHPRFQALMQEMK